MKIDWTRPLQFIRAGEPPRPGKYLGTITHPGYEHVVAVSPTDSYSEHDGLYRVSAEGTLYGGLTGAIINAPTKLKGHVIAVHETGYKPRLIDHVFNEPKAVGSLYYGQPIVACVPVEVEV